jgi:hypothetical protein
MSMVVHEKSHTCENSKQGECHLEIVTYDGDWTIQAKEDPHYFDFITFCPFCGEKLDQTAQQ